VNTKAFVILILAFLYASQGGSTGSYMYNSTAVLCDCTSTGCNYLYSGEYYYYCPAIELLVKCGKTIAVTDPPGSILCDPPANCSAAYYCDKLDSNISCDRKIVVPESVSFEGLEGGEQVCSNECPNLPESMVVVPRLGKGAFKPPEPASLVNTSEWGEVPANQILVIAKDDCCCLVEALVKSLEGRIVGYIDFINLFQIEFPGKNESSMPRGETGASG